jgi:fluoride exporter
VSPLAWFAVAVVGGLGAGCRFLLDRAVSTRVATRVPLGLLIINVGGSFAAGVVGGLAARSWLTDELRVVLAGGFLGAFTTFSTAMYDTARLLEERAWWRAAVNLVGVLVLAVVAAAFGWALVTS